MSKRGFVDWRAYGTEVKEVGYGDGSSEMDSSWDMDPNPTIIEPNERFINNEEVNGFEGPSETQILSMSTGHPHAQRAKPHAMAFWGAAAFGQITTTEVVSLAAGRVYRHDIILSNVPATLPSFGWVENQSDLIREFAGGVAGRLALSVERNAHWRLEADVLGSGTFVEVTTIRPPLLTAEPALTAGDTKVFLGTGTIDNTSLAQSNTVSNISGAPAALDCTLGNMNYELNNNLMADAESYGFATGKSRCQLERDQRAESLTFALEFDGTTLEYERLRNQTDVAMEFNAVSSVEIVPASGLFYGWVLAFPKLSYSAVPVEGGRSKQMLNITADLLEQGTPLNQRPTMFTVWNAQSVYLS